MHLIEFANNRNTREETKPVTRKILLTMMLLAMVAIAAKAIGQAPATSGATAPSLNPPGVSPAVSTPAAPGSTGPGKSPPTMFPSSPLPSSSTPSFGAPSSTKTDATKAEFGKSPASTKSDTTTSAKDASTGKDAASKSSPVSTAVQPSSSAAPRRTELVIPRALITLIDDNKVPATEPGMITKIEWKEGQSVEKGALVAEIDSRSTLAKSHIAESELLAARATAENTAEIEVAEKAVEVSKAEYDQSVEIREKSPSAISLTQLRKDKFNYEKSLAQVKQATNEKKIAGLTANAKQAQLDAAMIELDLRQIRAPFKGEVVEIMKKVGDWVTVGEPIMHIVGLDKVRVKGFVFVSGAEGASQEEVLGRDVKITVEAAGGKKRTINGKIGFASPIIDGVGTSRQFRIWAEVDNKKSIDPLTNQEIWELQPGSVATMTIDLTQAKPAVTSAFDPSKAGKSKIDTFKPVTTEKRVSKER